MFYDPLSMSKSPFGFGLRFFAGSIVSGGGPLWGVGPDLLLLGVILVTSNSDPDLGAAEIFKMLSMAFV